MRKTIVMTLIVGAFLCTGCAGLGPQTETEWAAFGSMWGAGWWDYETTRRNVNSGNSELNIALGPHPDDDAIALWKIGTCIFWTAMAELDKPENRFGWYLAGTSSSAMFAGWNEWTYANDRPARWDVYREDYGY